jgi:hypothetical protein
MGSLAFGLLEKHREDDMADLLDIAPSTAVEVIKIDGKRIIVRGLHGDAIASIVARFPELGALLGGGGINLGPRLIERFGAAIGPIIAAGCGHLSDEKYEQHASALLVEHQLKFLKAIIGLTFPNGVVSFVEAMTALLTRADEREKAVTVRLRKSPSPSQPSSDAVSRPTMQ